MHLLGEVSPEIQARIQGLSLEKLDLLAEEIFELTTMEKSGELVRDWNRK
jgi:hypothetical protein